MVNSGLWLSYILFSCPYDLSVNDKLFATYLTYLPSDNGRIKLTKEVKEIISKESGLSPKEVISSYNKLLTIEAISLSLVDSDSIVLEVM